MDTCISILIYNTCKNGKIHALPISQLICFFYLRPSAHTLQQFRYLSSKLLMCLDQYMQKNTQILNLRCLYANSISFETYMFTATKDSVCIQQDYLPVNKFMVVHYRREDNFYLLTSITQNLNLVKSNRERQTQAWLFISLVL